MDEFTGVDGSMSLADVGKRQMINKIYDFSEIIEVRSIKYNPGMDSPGLVVRADNGLIRTYNQKIGATPFDDKPSWHDEFVPFVEQFGYVFDGSEQPYPIQRPNESQLYFRPV